MNRKHISPPELYKHYYLNQVQQKGHGGPFFAGRLFQRGYGQRGGGIGNFFGSLFRKALPFLTSASKQVGKVALKTGANVLADAASGHRFQDSLKNRLKESGMELKRDVTQQVKNAMGNQTGSGKKRKRGEQRMSQQHKKQKQTKAKAKRIKRKKPTPGIRSSKATKPRTFQDIFGTSK